MKPKYLIKVRRRKGLIDLTEIGRQEQLLYALVHKDDWLKAKFPEAEILETYTEPSQPIPQFYPDIRPRFSILSAITRELLNFARP